MNHTPSLLAERCEKATAEQQRGLLRKAFDLIHPPQGDTDALFLSFERLIEAGAYLDAAMTLVPEGWEWQLENTGGETFGPFVAKFGQLRDVEAKTLPLAICAAGLRARANG